jgi:hypothetical protein
MTTEIGLATVPYNIHKATLLCLEPEKAIKDLLIIFGKHLKEVKVPDKALSDRGIKWVMFPQSGEQIHLAPPNRKDFHKTLLRIMKKESTTPVLQNTLKESHVGILVPDLTPIVNRAVKNTSLELILNQRQDGMYQFYFNLPGCIDYLEVSSLVYDEKEGLLPVLDFSPHKDYEPQGIFIDPNHPKGYRKVSLKNHEIIICGRDGPGKKKWEIKGTIKNKKGKIDFSDKPGPNPGMVNVKFEKNKIIFPDGNSWTKKMWNHDFI